QAGMPAALVRPLVEQIVFSRRKAIATRNDGQATLGAVEWERSDKHIQAYFEAVEPGGRARSACLIKGAGNRIVTATLYRGFDRPGPPLSQQARALFSCVEV